MIHRTVPPPTTPENPDGLKGPGRDPLVELLDAVILDSIDDAAAASHRPEHVRYWLDANSRNLLAERIAEQMRQPLQIRGMTTSDDDDTASVRLSKILMVRHPLAAFALSDLGINPDVRANRLRETPYRAQEIGRS